MNIKISLGENAIEFFHQIWTKKKSLSVLQTSSK